MAKNNRQKHDITTMTTLALAPAAQRRRHSGSGAAPKT
jgi:hypothetical protein